VILVIVITTAGGGDSVALIGEERILKSVLRKLPDCMSSLFRSSSSACLLAAMAEACCCICSASNTRLRSCSALSTNADRKSFRIFLSLDTFTFISASTPRRERLDEEEWLLVAMGASSLSIHRVGSIEAGASSTEEEQDDAG
jgi:hypothetical protein